jgi:hypothetical protein
MVVDKLITQLWEMQLPMAKKDLVKAQKSEKMFQQ